jgi:hypothetical protein
VAGVVDPTYAGIDTSVANTVDLGTALLSWIEREEPNRSSEFMWHTFLTLHHQHNQSEIITQLALGLVECAAPHQEAMMVATL